MSEFENGGPAFPVAENFDERRGEYIQYASNGMTLRDYFAAKAMVAIINQESDLAFGGRRSGIAMTAYEMADAMLAARETNHD